MTILAQMPCGGSMFNASIKLTYPAGSWQPDIQLTYAGTGPVPAPNVVVISGQPSNPQPCPPSGTAPPPFSFVIKNIGTYGGYPSFNVTDMVEANTIPWSAQTGLVPDPSNPPVINPNDLPPGGIWTITFTPVAGEVCDRSTPYRVYMTVNGTQSTALTYIFK
jgi:hypothetical protein